MQENEFVTKLMDVIPPPQIQALIGRVDLPLLKPQAQGSSSSKGFFASPQTDNNSKSTPFNSLESALESFNYLFLVMEYMDSDLKKLMEFDPHVPLSEH